MRPYKTKDLNEKVKKAVRKANDYFSANPDASRKYLSNDEFTLDITRICGIPHSIAKRVTWFIRSDGARDEKALAEWGFNKHTA